MQVEIYPKSTIHKSMIFARNSSIYFPKIKGKIRIKKHKCTKPKLSTSFGQETSFAVLFFFEIIQLEM